MQNVDTATGPGIAPANIAIEDVAAFHGHLCPSLALGFRIARWALQMLQCPRPHTDELVVVAESTDSALDAIQYIAGCTFGKRTLIVRDYGKRAYTFYDRRDGKGIRIGVTYAGLADTPRLTELRELLESGTASFAQRQEYFARAQARLDFILSAPEEDFLTVGPARHPMPSPGARDRWGQCALCREPTMESRLTLKKGMLMCHECADRY